MTGLRALTCAAVLCLQPLAPSVGADLLSPTRMSEEAPHRGFVFAGLDATSHGTVFAHAGVGAALDGNIDASGPVMRLFAGGGQFSYELGEGQAVDGAIVAADALGGYQWVTGQTYVTLLEAARYSTTTCRRKTRPTPCVARRSG